MGDIASEAGVAIGLINYHFGGRDELVAAAELEMFVGMLEHDIVAISKVLTSAESSEELVRRLGDFTRIVISPSRFEYRMRRIASIAGAHGRPEMLRKLRSAQSEITTRYEAAIAEAQRRGTVRADLAPRAISTFLLVLGIGYVMIDLDPDGPSEDEMAAVLETWITTMVP